MTSRLRSWIGARLWYEPIRQYRVRRRQRAEVLRWESSGRPDPPPHTVKQQLIREYSREYRTRVLVETGTYYGDMIGALEADFERIYSIELSPQLHARASRRFRRLNHVEVIQGDSGVELGVLLPRIERPALFWLDGHYSGGETSRGANDTPIYRELEHILGVPCSGDVILIDDARLFGTDPAYPTLDELRAFVLNMAPSARIFVETDIIAVIPGQAA